MKRRAGAAALVGTLVAALTGCAAVPPPFACPLVAYVYMDPVHILIDLPMAGAETVAACFNEGCEVAPIHLGDDGMYVLPQEEPFITADSLGINPGTVVTVAVTRGGTTYEYVTEVPYEVLEPGPCPSPVEFQPVVIG
jgi:hypothetical protein